MKTEDLPLIFAFSLVAGVLIAVACILASSYSQKQDACEESKGVLVRAAAGGYVCVKAQ